MRTDHTLFFIEQRLLMFVVSVFLTALSHR
jgi:hypothetical protein